VKHFSIAAAALLVTASAARTMAADPADPGVTLVGVGSVAGTESDLSGLKGSSICALDVNKQVTANCIDQATLGGFGSAFTYTGFDHVSSASPIAVRSTDAPTCSTPPVSTFSTCR
jgi:hypothetical protein